MSDYGINDIDLMVKQANVLRRLASASRGALGGGTKGMLVGGALGLGAAPLAGLGLAGALGVGGAGAAAMGMLGGGAGATVGALKGLFRKAPGVARAGTQVARTGAQASRVGQAAAHTLAHDPSLALRASSVLPAAAIGGGIGYLASGEGHGGTGLMLGIAGGLAARPLLRKSLAKRAGRGVV